MWMSSITLAVILILQIFFFSFIFYKWFQFHWIQKDNQRVLTEISKNYMLLSNNFNKDKVLKNYFTWNENLDVAYYEISDVNDLEKFKTKKYCIWKIYVLYIPWESFQKLSRSNFLSTFSDDYYYKIKHMRSFMCYSKFHMYDFIRFKYF